MRSIAMLLFLFGLSSCYSRAPLKTGLEGKPIPSFNLLLPDSTTYFNTNSIASGKPVVLFYFLPDCPHCRVQMEEIIKNMKILKNIQFCILTPAAFHEMKLFYNHYQLGKYKNITTGIDYTSFFADYYKTSGVPYMAIYGKNKRLQNVYVGEIYGRQIKEATEN